LDGNILAAARAAVESRPIPAKPSAKRRSTRWTVPLAVAATVVLAVGVVRMVRESGEFEAPLRSEAARSSAKPAAEVGALGAGRAERSLANPLPEAALPAAPPASVFSLESPARAPTGVSSDHVGGERSPAEPLIAPAAAPQSAPAKSLAGKRESPAPVERETDGERKMAPAALEEQKAANTGHRLSRSSPEQWLKEIAELRRRGRTAEADASLAEFRRRYPAYPLDGPPAPR